MRIFVLPGSEVRQVSLYFPPLILQTIAAGIGTSNFFQAFNGFLELFIYQIDEIDTSQLSCIVDLRFFDSPLLLFFSLTFKMGGPEQSLESLRKAMAYGKKKTAENVHRARNRVTRPEIAEIMGQLERTIPKMEKYIAYLKDIGAYDFRDETMVSILKGSC